MKCFHDDVRVMRLDSGTVVSSSKAKLQAAFDAQQKQQLEEEDATVASGGALNDRQAAEAVKSVFIEAAAAGSSKTSLCLNFFSAGRAPGLGPRGVQAPNELLEKGTGVAVMLRVTENRVNALWIAEDKGTKGSSSDSNSNSNANANARAGVEGSELWAEVIAVARDSIVGESSKGSAPKLRFHLNDYSRYICMLGTYYSHLHWN